MDVEFLKYKFRDGYNGVITQTKWQVGVRHVQMTYMVLCAAALGALRASAGVALLALTDASRRNDSYVQAWDVGDRGAALWAFFSGHALALLPAELYLPRLGDKFVVTAVLLINGSLNAAMPTIVNRGGWTALCNAYFLMGMTQPCLAPVNRALLDNWLPPIERQTAACIIDTGSYVGMILALPASSWLSGSRLGWELVAYAQATLALSLAVLWSLLTAASPEQHHACPDAEREYIKEASAECRKKRQCVPWRSMLRCRRVVGLALAHAANNALFIFYLVDVPLYLKSTGLSLLQCGVQAMIPFIALLMLVTTTAPTIGCLLKSNMMAHVFNVTYIKKVINAIGTVSIVAGLAMAPNMPEQWSYLRLCVLTVTLGLLAFQYAGFIENVRDLSENYRGTLIVITSAFSSVVGAVVPLGTGMILRNENKPDAWRVVFCSIASVYGVCSMAGSALGDAGLALWDRMTGGARGHDFAYHNTGLSPEEASQLELLDMYPNKPIAGTPSETIA
ncbi:Putative inorganic phosphate cotransporter [Papilio machaon]|uniref:Putative inorganic phosphate cotransporter n=1 Tax=Papilio machaon TaxID=76193 RepID=A0A0N0PD34_PAPMA|nr:Putative inorganic phosphate cotransporter [Papilio machaon]